MLEHPFVAENFDRYLFLLDNLCSRKRILKFSSYRFQITEPLLPKSLTQYKCMAVMTSDILKETSKTSKVDERMQRSIQKLQQPYITSAEKYFCSSREEFLQTIILTNSQADTSQDVSSGVLSSNLDATEWIKRCTTADKDYLTNIDPEEHGLKALKQGSACLANSIEYSRSHKSNNSSDIRISSSPCEIKTEKPVTVMSADDLADSMPGFLHKSSVGCQSIKSASNEIKKMVDKNTSDYQTNIEYNLNPINQASTLLANSIKSNRSQKSNNCNVMQKSFSPSKVKTAPLPVGPVTVIPGNNPADLLSENLHKSSVQCQSTKSIFNETKNTSDYQTNIDNREYSLKSAKQASTFIANSINCIRSHKSNNSSDIRKSGSPCEVKTAPSPVGPVTMRSDPPDLIPENLHKSSVECQSTKSVLNGTKNTSDFQTNIDSREYNLKSPKQASTFIANSMNCSRSQKSNINNTTLNSSKPCEANAAPLPIAPVTLLCDDNLADLVPVNFKSSTKSATKKMVDKNISDFQTNIYSEEHNMKALIQGSTCTINSINCNKSQKSNNSNNFLKSRLPCEINTVRLPIAPVNELCDDNLVDLIAETLKHSTKKIATSEIKKMVDKNTSDNILCSKHVVESVLQTCPDIRDAATDKFVANMVCGNKQNACVLTSKCILPSPKPCLMKFNNSNDCLFVYDKPYCAIHKPKVDTAIQSSILSDHGKIGQCRFCRSSRLDTPRRKITKTTIGDVLSPKVYKVLYETTKMVVKDAIASTVRDTGINCENDAALIRAVAARDSDMMTSQGLKPFNYNCNPKCDSVRQRAEYVYANDTHQQSAVVSTNISCNYHARLLDLPPRSEADYIEERVKSHLLCSCRYYSNLLTKQLELVKEKVTKHRTPSNEKGQYFKVIANPVSYTEACTMKPSGRKELGCQAYRSESCQNKQPACALSPSLTNISQDADRTYLKSVYYMLSSIEGRIRRLKRNMPS